MGQPLADVRREIAVAVLTEWLADLMTRYPHDLYLPCGHCLAGTMPEPPLPGESEAHYRRRMKQRAYQREYRKRKLVEVNDKGSNE